jgi:hypothetical protein
MRAGRNLQVVGPKSISEPCDDASEMDVTFDASYSSDPSKRQLVSVQWHQAGALDPTLQVRTWDLVSSVPDSTPHHSWHPHNTILHPIILVAGSDGHCQR